MTNKDARFYYDVLQSNECACGKTKRPGFAFCYHCYTHGLPEDLQKPLWQKIGEGFEAAYEEAFGWLTTWEWGE